MQEFFHRTLAATVRRRYASVDEVLEINDIDESHILPMPSMLVKADTQYLDRVANVDGKLILLLDVEKYADQYNKD